MAERDKEGVHDVVGVTVGVMDGLRLVDGVTDGELDRLGVTLGEDVMDGVTLDVGEGVRDVVCEQRDLQSASEMLHSVQFVVAMALRSSSHCDALRYQSICS